MGRDSAALTYCLADLLPRPNPTPHPPPPPRPHNHPPSSSPNMSSLTLQTTFPLSRLRQHSQTCHWQHPAASRSQSVVSHLSMQCCVTAAEPARSLQTQTMGPARSGGRQGGQSGPQGMLSAEPSMPDQDGENSPHSILCPTTFQLRHGPTKQHLLVHCLPYSTSLPGDD